MVYLYKMMISSGFFFFFFSKFLFFWVVWGREVKGQKMVQNEKKLCRAPYLRKHTLYDPDFWYTCVKR